MKYEKKVEFKFKLSGKNTQLTKIYINLCKLSTSGYFLVRYIVTLTHGVARCKSYSFVLLLYWLLSTDEWEVDYWKSEVITFVVEFFVFNFPALLISR